MKYLASALVLAAIGAPLSAQVTYHGSISTVTTRIGPADGMHDVTVTNGVASPGPYEASNVRSISDKSGYTESSSSVGVTSQSEDSGSVVFHQSVTNSGVSTEAAAFGQFVTLFDISSPMIFSVNYVILSTGDDLVALPPLAQQAFIDDTFGNYYLTFDPLFGSGSMSALLPAGSYIFRIQDFYANKIESADVQRTLSSQFNYSLSPTAAIPEPSTWAMLITGFLMVGAGMRNRARVSLLYDCRR